MDIRRMGLALYCLTLMGCIATAPIVHPVFQAPEHKNSSSFIVGQSMETRTGEPMVAKEDLYFYDGLVATAAYQPKPYYVSFVGMEIIYPTIEKGTKFKPIGRFDNGDVLYESLNPLKPIGVNWTACLVVKPSGDVDGDAICRSGDLRRVWDDKPSNFLKKEKVYTQGSVREELIYNGKTKDTIKVAYREYKDDLARPAFYQDLTYDLSESKIIGFRRMNIEVIEATNSSIKFIVKSPME